MVNKTKQPDDEIISMDLGFGIEMTITHAEQRGGEVARSVQKCEVANC